MNAPRDDAPFWTYEYIVLIGVAMFGFGNIAVFYGFSSYLERLGVDPAWRGPLLAAEPLAALFVRPVLGVRLGPDNSLRTARLALCGVGSALLCYPFAASVPALLAVRVFHGLAFVCLVSAVITLLSTVIRPEYSGRAFSYYTLSSLVPYALTPPLAERLLPLVGGEARLYAWVAVCVLPALALLGPLGKILGRNRAEARAVARPGWAQTLANLRRPRTALLLGTGFFLFMSTNQVFFFMKPYLGQLSMSEPGLYFTVATGATLAVRVHGGKYFDTWPRCATLAASLCCLAACLVLFPFCPNSAVLLCLAAVYGAAIGVAMPMLNAALFTGSAPEMRAANLNFLLFTMDAGFVLGPLLGGAVLARTASYSVFFAVCAALAGLALACCAPLALKEPPLARRPRSG